jgi:hypothetical protein
MEPPNPLEKYKDLLPSKSELVCRSLFAATEKERKAAKRLADVVPEAKDQEHPLLTLKRLYPEGSEALRLASLTPIGQSVEEICAMQPDEINDELVDELMDLLEQNKQPEPAQAAEIAIVPVEPPPAPPEPTAWANRNFKDPVRQAQNEPTKINKWTAGKSSTSGSWDDAGRPFLDA